MNEKEDVDVEIDGEDVLEQLEKEQKEIIWHKLPHFLEHWFDSIYY